MSIWAIVIVVMLASFIVQQVLNSRIKRYEKVATNMSGAQVAMKMLRENGINDVQVTCIPGTLTDHFNPQTKTVNLSRATYEGSNVAAIAVAAHECGHAIQHASGYAPLRMRSALVPVVNFANNAVQWVLLLGVLVTEYNSGSPVGRDSPVRRHHFLQYRDPACRTQCQFACSGMAGGQRTYQLGDLAYGKRCPQVGCIYLCDCCIGLSRHAAVLYQPC